MKAREKMADMDKQKYGTKEKKRVMAVAVRRLRERYPDAVCSLDHGGDPWRLLMMARLSAQCTDARVNIVCRELFARFPDAEAMAGADVEKIEAIVKPCGLYRMKAKDLKGISEALIARYGGEVPSDMESLLTLPGVGRKIANLILGDVYGVPGVVADTHCIRICGKLGMYPEEMKNPATAERILAGIIAPEEQTDLCHRLVLFGRDVCVARSPRCEVCPLSDICAHNGGSAPEAEKRVESAL